MSGISACGHSADEHWTSELRNLCSENNVYEPEKYLDMLDKLRRVC